MLQCCPICIPLVRRHWSRAGSERGSPAAGEGTVAGPREGGHQPCTVGHKGLGNLRLGYLPAVQSLKRGERSKVPSDICIYYLILLRNLHVILVVLRLSTLLLHFLELRPSLVFISTD